MSTVPRTLVIMAAGFAVTVMVGFAQTDIATGTLQGVVEGFSGEPMAGVAVSTENAETGFSRAQITDPQGHFRIPLLPPGQYSLVAVGEGLASYEQRGLRLRVGEALFIRIRLGLPTVTDRLVVTEETDLVEITKASVTSTIDSMMIESLPSNGRDFRDLMFLAPQVGESAGRPSVAGGEGMMNSFNVDGADSNSLFFGEQLGGIIPPFTYSQAAIQEFQILRSSYNVRFGGAAGGIVNAVTRSGTNALHGGAFLFFQDSGMMATDALGHRQDDFDRRQGGFNVGGAIKRDKLHFFLAYDAQRRDQNALRQPLGLASELEAAFDARLASLGIDPDAEFDYVVTNDTDVFLLRLDWILGERHRLWLRNNRSGQRGDNLTFAFPTSGQSSLGREENPVHSSVLSLTSVLGSRTFNEAIAQYSLAERPRQPNFTAVPQTAIGGFDAVFGQGTILPSSLDEDRLQLQNNLTLLRGNHTLRFGLDYSHLEFDNSFQVARGGFYFLPSYEEFLEDAPCSVIKPGQPPCVYAQAFSAVDGQVSFDTDLLSAYAGDEWRLNPDLTLEFGLRLEHQENPSAQNPNPLEPRTASIPDGTNLAPRLGFAWDLEGNGRSVLRGGAGVFSNWTPSLLVSNAVLGNGVNGSTVILFQGFSPFFPEYPNRLPPEVGALGGAPPDIFLFSPDFENPETTRYSLGYERAVAESFRFGAEGTYSESRHRARQWDVNLDPAPIDYFVDGRPIYGGPQARLDPRFGQKLQFTSDAEAEYLSVVLAVLKRYSRNWSLLANYTYAESRDHDSFETESIATAPEDHYNLEQDWGWSSSDVRHRVVVSGVYTAPYGFTLAFVGRYRDAFPVNALAGFDLNNDGTGFDRPGPDHVLGLDRHLARNSFRGSSAATLDLRFSKAFAPVRDHEFEAMVEVFNVTDEAVFTAFDTAFVRFGQLNPVFGEPIQASQPRTLQIGLRYRF